MKRLGWLLLGVLAACNAKSPYQRAMEESRGDGPRFVESCLNLRTRAEANVTTRPVLDGPYRWQTAPYVLRANGSGVILNVTVTIQWGRSIRSLTESRARLQQIQETMIQFFAKHGIELVLAFHEVTSDAQVTIEAEGASRDFNATHWALKLRGNYANGYDPVATAITHEFSHLLGLIDEYEDHNIPGRWVGETDSIMRNCWVPSTSVKFHARHLGIIVGPLCAAKDSPRR